MDLLSGKRAVWTFSWGQSLQEARGSGGYGPLNHLKQPLQVFRECGRPRRDQQHKFDYAACCLLNFLEGPKVGRVCFSLRDLRKRWAFPFDFPSTHLRKGFFFPRKTLIPRVRSPEKEKGGVRSAQRKTHTHTHRKGGSAEKTMGENTKSPPKTSSGDQLQPDAGWQSPPQGVLPVWGLFCQLCPGAAAVFFFFLRRWPQSFGVPGGFQGGFKLLFPAGGFWSCLSDVLCPLEFTKQSRVSGAEQARNHGIRECLGHGNLFALIALCNPKKDTQVRSPCQRAIKKQTLLHSPFMRLCFRGTNRECKRLCVSLVSAMPFPDEAFSAPFNRTSLAPSKHQYASGMSLVCQAQLYNSKDGTCDRHGGITEEDAFHITPNHTLKHRQALLFQAWFP